MEYYSGEPDNLAAASVMDYCTGVLTGRQLSLEPVNERGFGKAHSQRSP